MSSRFRDIITGLVAIGAALGFAVLLMRFGELAGLERSRWTLTVLLDDAGGLRTGNVVTLNGVPIGTIHDIALDHTRRPPVVVTGRIRPEHTVPESSLAHVQGSILGGGAILALTAIPGDTAPTNLPIDGTASLIGSGAGPIERAIAQMGETLRSQLREEIAPFRDAADAVTAMAQRFRTVGDQVETILTPLADAVRDGNGQTIDGAVSAIAAAFDEFASMARMAQAWLGDEALRRDVGGVVEDARLTLTSLQATADRFGRLADELDGHAGRMVGGVMPVADELAAAVGDLRRMMALATDGEGSVAQLLNRPELHDNLVDAARRLDRALAELELLFAKIRQEGIRLDF